VPGGYWREMDYGGVGWLVRRVVQTGEASSETTLYSYDTWGRLRGIDYPRSADVRMGWDGENQRSTLTRPQGGWRVNSAQVRWRIRAATLTIPMAVVRL